MGTSSHCVQQSQVCENHNTEMSAPQRGSKCQELTQYAASWLRDSLQYSGWQLDSVDGVLMFEVHLSPSCAPRDPGVWLSWSPMNGNSPTAGCDTGLLASAGSCAMLTPGWQVTPGDSSLSHISQVFCPVTRPRRSRWAGDRPEAGHYLPGQAVSHFTVQQAAEIDPCWWHWWWSEVSAVVTGACAGAGDLSRACVWAWRGEAACCWPQTVGTTLEIFPPRVVPCDQTRNMAPAPTHQIWNLYRQELIISVLSVSDDLRDNKCNILF